MFEKYNLVSVELPDSINEHNFPRQAKPFLTQIQEKNTGKNAEQYMSSEENRGVIDGFFHIGGKIETLPIFFSKEQSNDDIIRMQSFVICESTANYYTDRSNFSSYLLCYTYEGEGTLIYNNETYILQKGEGFLIDCRKHQRYFSSSNKWKHLDLHFCGSYADNIYQHIQSGIPVKFSFSSEKYFNDYIEKILETCTSISSHKRIYIHHAVYELLVAILRENERKISPAIPDVYAKLIQYMDSHYMNKITIDDLAQRAFLDKYYLIKKFKKYTGSTPTEYLITLRIQKACALLQSTNIPIAQICYASGFENRTNFARQFKKRMNTTPIAYRQSFSLYIPKEPT